MLNIIKNPVTDHLPTNAIRVGLSFDSPVVKINDFVQQTPPIDGPSVFFIGAMAHGADDFEYVDKKISISEYPLSASVACGKLCCAFENLWNIN